MKKQALFGLLAGAVLYGGHESQADKMLAVSNCTGSAGGIATTWVTLDDASGLACLELRLNYNRNLLMFQDATAAPDTLGGKFALDLEPGDGVVTIRLFRDSDIALGSGKLLLLSFSVNPGAEPGMTVPVIVAETDLGDQFGADLRWKSNVDVQDAQFTVSDPSARQMALVRQSTAGGRVTGSPNGSYLLDSPILLTAVPDPYFHFVGWTGDTDGISTNTVMTLSMNRPRAIQASFAPDLTSETRTPHGWLAQYGLTNRSFEVEAADDADGDGYFNWEEYIGGTLPVNAGSRPPPLRWSQGHLQIESSKVGRIYWIDAKQSLRDPAWRVYTNRNGSGSDLLLHVDPAAPSRFFRYRIQVQEP